MLEEIVNGADVPVVLQGATGRTGRRHLSLMRAYGTNIIAGVSRNPSVAEVDGIPVFPSCAAATEATGAVASVLMVPPLQVLPAIEEAVDAGIRLIVSVPEGVPALDALKAARLTHARGVTLIGSSTPGVAIPGRLKLGFIPDAALSPGPLGVMSKSGTLSYELCHRLVRRGVGQSCWIGVGGDSVKGLRFADLVPMFERHAGTRGILVVGEIGGSEEEELAQALRARGYDCPVFVVLTGASAPEGVIMGHAGALIHRGAGSLASKRAALEAAGARVFTRMNDAVDAVIRALAPAGPAADERGRIGSGLIRGGAS